MNTLITDVMSRIKDLITQVRSTTQFKIINFIIWMSLCIYGIVIVSLILDSTINVTVTCPTNCFGSGSCANVAYISGFETCISIKNTEGEIINSVLFGVIMIIQIMIMMRFIQLHKTSYDIQNISSFLI
jgi:hypothetical protein